VERGTLALPTFGSHDGQFPGTAGQGRVWGTARGGGERLALAVLHVALLTVALIDRLDAERAVVLDGTFCGSRCSPGWSRRCGRGGRPG
jgi:hypothetical protein